MTTEPIIVNPENFYAKTRFLKGGRVYRCEPGVYDVSGTGQFWPNPIAGETFVDPVTVEAADPKNKPVFKGVAKNGAAFNLGFYYKENLVVRDLHFQGIEGHAILCKNSSGITIQGCQFEEIKKGSGIQCNQSQRVVVVGCEFDQCGAVQDYGVGEGVYVDGGKGIDITSCTFLRCGHYGCTIQKANEVLFAGNFINNDWGGGVSVLLGSTSVTIRNNPICSVGAAYPMYPKAAIQVCASGNRVFQNVISGTSHANPAIVLYAYNFKGYLQNCEENDVYHNLIYQVGGPAVIFNKKTTCQNRNNRFRSNVIYRCNQMEDKYYGRSAIVFDDYHASVGYKWAEGFDGNVVESNLHDDVTWMYNGKWTEKLQTQYDNELIYRVFDREAMYDLVDLIPRGLRP